METPFKYISDDQHTDIGTNILKGDGGRYNTGIDCFLEIVLHRNNRIRAFRAYTGIQCLILRGILIGHEFHTEFAAVFGII